MGEEILPKEITLWIILGDYLYLPLSYNYFAGSSNSGHIWDIYGGVGA